MSLEETSELEVGFCPDCMMLEPKCDETERKSSRAFTSRVWLPLSGHPIFSVGPRLCMVNLKEPLTMEFSSTLSQPLVTLLG
jgi:hypothetical protein